MNKTIPLTLPEGVWGRLATKADKEGRKVADLLAEAVVRALNPAPVAPPPVVAAVFDAPADESPSEKWVRWQGMVAELHSRGWTDREMTVALTRDHPGDGWTRARVGDMRRKSHLPPNKPSKPKL